MWLISCKDYKSCKTWFNGKVTPRRYESSPHSSTLADSEHLLECPFLMRGRPNGHPDQRQDNCPKQIWIPMKLDDTYHGTIRTTCFWKSHGSDKDSEENALSIETFLVQYITRCEDVAQIQEHRVTKEMKTESPHPLQGRVCTITVGSFHKLEL